MFLRTPPCSNLDRQPAAVLNEDASRSSADAQALPPQGSRVRPPQEAVSRLPADAPSLGVLGRNSCGCFSVGGTGIGIPCRGKRRSSPNPLCSHPSSSRSDHRSTTRTEGSLEGRICSQVARSSIHAGNSRATPDAERQQQQRIPASDRRCVTATRSPCRACQRDAASARLPIAALC